jgi:tetratricopeptide (TPR) repeat protein
MTTPPTTTPSDSDASPQTGADFAELGWTNKAKGDFNSAEANFNQAKLMDDQLVDAYYGLGLIYKENSDESSAIRAFEKVIELINANVLKDQPNRATILKNMTNSQINLMKSKGAGAQSV